MQRVSSYSQKVFSTFRNPYNFIHLIMNSSTHSFICISMLFLYWECIQPWTSIVPSEIPSTAPRGLSKRRTCFVVLHFFRRRIVFIARQTFCLKAWNEKTSASNCCSMKRVPFSKSYVFYLVLRGFARENTLFGKVPCTRGTSARLLWVRNVFISAEWDPLSSILPKKFIHFAPGTNNHNYNFRVFQVRKNGVVIPNRKFVLQRKGSDQSYRFTFQKAENKTLEIYPLKHETSLCLVNESLHL